MRRLRSADGMDAVGLETRPPAEQPAYHAAL